MSLRRRGLGAVAALRCGSWLPLANCHCFSVCCRLHSVVLCCAAHCTSLESASQAISVKQLHLCLTRTYARAHRHIYLQLPSSWSSSHRGIIIIIIFHCSLLRLFSIWCVAFATPPPGTCHCRCSLPHTSGVVASEKLFKEVHTTKHGLVRIYKVMNVSQGQAGP